MQYNKVTINKSLKNRMNRLEMKLLKTNTIIIKIQKFSIIGPALWHNASSGLLHCQQRTQAVVPVLAAPCPIQLPDKQRKIINYLESSTNNKGSQDSKKTGKEEELKYYRYSGMQFKEKK